MNDAFCMPYRMSDTHSVETDKPIAVCVLLLQNPVSQSAYDPHFVDVKGVLPLIDSMK